MVTVLTTAGALFLNVFSSVVVAVISAVAIVRTAPAELR